ncbi:MAG: hypothetical protein GQ574_16360 [Crocinitomix sp.]|nr:hypothetical protein [Crocinitomix sp.]
MRFFIILLFLVSIFSCGKKESVVTVDSRFVGGWSHVSIDSYHTISINSESRGTNIGGPDWPLMTGDQQRKWFVKDSVLEFGHMAPKEEKFHIDTFPQIATIIDTIGWIFLEIGDKYMWLDGRIYKANN